MNGAGVGRALLFAFGALAPVGWGILTFFELDARATELALALTVVGAATGMLLLWAWLERMSSLADRLERLVHEASRRSAPSSAASPLPVDKIPPSPSSPASLSAPRPAAGGKTGAASHGGKGYGYGSPVPAKAPPVPAPEPAGLGYYDEERRPESAPPPFPQQPAAAAGGYGFSGEPLSMGALPAAAANPQRGGRRLDPAALAAAWNDLKFNGNGAFDAKSLAAVLAAGQIEAEIEPPDNFIGLGAHLLVVVEPGQRERAFLMPDFTRLAKAFDKWFDLDQKMPPSARIEKLLRPAELKRSGNRYELAVRGRLE